MSRPLKLKVTGTVLCSVFQLLDHGSIGQFAGAYRRRFFPERVGWASADRLWTGKIAVFFSGIYILFRHAAPHTATRRGHDR
jgi:hypothetical protein